MGSEYNATCNSCGNEFSLSIGGGFLFDLLRCDKCGGGKSIYHNDLAELEARYFAELSGSYTPGNIIVKNDEWDWDVRLSRDNEVMLKILEPCKCGGRFLYRCSASLP
jgi:hypothetical protein